MVIRKHTTDVLILDAHPLSEYAALVVGGLSAVLISFTLARWAEMDRNQAVVFLFWAVISLCSAIIYWVLLQRVVFDHTSGQFLMRSRIRIQSAMPLEQIIAVRAHRYAGADLGVDLIFREGDPITLPVMLGRRFDRFAKELADFLKVPLEVEPFDPHYPH